MIKGANEKLLRMYDLKSTDILRFASMALPKDKYLNEFIKGTSKMKKYIFLFIAAILTVSSTAKTIHWITFIDTTDKRVDAQGVDHGVGEMDKNGRKGPLFSLY